MQKLKEIGFLKVTALHMGTSIQVRCHVCDVCTLHHDIGKRKVAGIEATPELEAAQKCHGSTVFELACHAESYQFVLL